MSKIAWMIFVAVVTCNGHPYGHRPYVAHSNQASSSGNKDGLGDTGTALARSHGPSSDEISGGYGGNQDFVTEGGYGRKDTKEIGGGHSTIIDGVRGQGDLGGYNPIPIISQDRYSSQSATQKSEERHNGLSGGYSHRQDTVRDITGQVGYSSGTSNQGGYGGMGNTKVTEEHGVSINTPGIGYGGSDVLVGGQDGTGAGRGYHTSQVEGKDVLGDLTVANGGGPLASGGYSGSQGGLGETSFTLINQGGQSGQSGEDIARDYSESQGSSFGGYGGGYDSKDIFVEQDGPGGHSYVPIISQGGRGRQTGNSVWHGIGSQGIPAGGYGGNKDALGGQNGLQGASFIPINDPSGHRLQGDHKSFDVVESNQGGYGSHGPREFGGRHIGSQSRTGRGYSENLDVLGGKRNQDEFIGLGSQDGYAGGYGGNRDGFDGPRFYDSQGISGQRSRGHNGSGPSGYTHGGYGGGYSHGY